MTKAEEINVLESDLQDEVRESINRCASSYPAQKVAAALRPLILEIATLKFEVEAMKKAQDIAHKPDNLA